jgi:glycosyltransferase involved in cell wall biosynthesis
MVVLEAMQQGIATIVTIHTGLDELIQDKEHTLYIDPYDINSIFSAMSYMTNKQNRLQIGLRGKELLHRYNFNTEFKTIIQQHLL